jgi:hypothetical protein
VTLAKVRPATMNTTKMFAVLLVALGIAAFAYQGISYTTRKNVVDLGPIHVTTEQSHTLPLPPIVGALSLLAGIGLFALEGKKQ